MPRIGPSQIASAKLSRYETLVTRGAVPFPALREDEISVSGAAQMT